jgi:hypothetical protein
MRGHVEACTESTFVTQAPIAVSVARAASNGLPREAHPSRPCKGISRPASSGPPGQHAPHIALATFALPSPPCCKARHIRQRHSPIIGTPAHVDGNASTDQRPSTAQRVVSMINALSYGLTHIGTSVIGTKRLRAAETRLLRFPNGIALRAGSRGLPVKISNMSLLTSVSIPTCRP